MIGPHDSIFVHVYIDADDPPEALMLGYKTNRWHGAVWGTEDKIKFGTINKSIGGLPETGKWAKLEIPAKAVADPGTDLPAHGKLSKHQEDCESGARIRKGERQHFSNGT